MKKRAGRLYSWVFVLLCVPLLYFLADRIGFVWSSKTTQGNVEEISASNGRCGGKYRYSCTEYEALIVYDVDGMTHRIKVEAGRKRGHDQPLSHADHRQGDTVEVAYDPRQPERAYRDTWWDIWGVPFWIFLTQIAAFFGNLREREREQTAWSGR